MKVEDITERIRMDEMMIQSEKMLSEGGLAAGMAHETDNPLAGILQGMHNIQRHLSPGLRKNTTAPEESGISLNKLRICLEKRGL